MFTPFINRSAVIIKPARCHGHLSHHGDGVEGGGLGSRTQRGGGFGAAKRLGEGKVRRCFVFMSWLIGAFD